MDYRKSESTCMSLPMNTPRRKVVRLGDNNACSDRGQKTGSGIFI